MAYTKQTWVNSPDESTPISAERLNHMEGGIEEVSLLADAIKKIIDEGQFGSLVKVTPLVSEGTHIADISVDDTNFELYSPVDGGGVVGFNTDIYKSTTQLVTSIPSQQWTSVYTLTIEKTGVYCIDALYKVLGAKTTKGDSYVLQLLVNDNVVCTTSCGVTGDIAYACALSKHLNLAKDDIVTLQVWYVYSISEVNNDGYLEAIRMFTNNLIQAEEGSY